MKTPFLIYNLYYQYLSNIKIMKYRSKQKIINKINKIDPKTSYTYGIDLCNSSECINGKLLPLIPTIIIDCRSEVHAKIRNCSYSFTLLWINIYFFPDKKAESLYIFKNDNNVLERYKLINKNELISL
jgi:hypothetical protein